jgi:signal transduction histidine kinase
MHLLPRSLFGRLVLVLLAGLLIAQFASVMILLQDRGTAVYRASGLQAAQRIAGVVELLDTLEPRQRQQVAAAMTTSALRVALYDAPPPAPAPGQAESARAAMLQATVRRTLGEARAMQITVTDLTEDHARPTGRLRRDASGRRPRHSMAFSVHVQLRDGTWVGFYHRLPRELFAWPQRLLLMLTVLLVSVVALSLLAVRWLSRPLSVLAQAATELGQDLRRPPLPERGPLEVQRAARAFNRMQTRIQRQIEDRERLLAAVSHDLRTPITRLRLRAEALEDPALKARFERDLADMEAMVSATLAFMRTGADREATVPVDVMALLESIQTDMTELGHQVDVAGRALAPYRGQLLALKRALVNVMDNAVKYGQRADVRVEDTPSALHIVVADDGPGIPPAELEKVFEPFYRLDPSRSRDSGGVGLGLAIARNIARAHGGDLILRNRAQGGLEAVLTLPRAHKS